MEFDAPPSYESIIGTVKGRLPEKASAEDIFRAVETLSDNELSVIAAEAGKQPQLTPEEQKLFDSKMAEGIAKSSKEMKETGKKVAEACTKINDMFDHMIIELTKVDAKNMAPPEGAFVPRVKIHQKDYRDLAFDSSRAALRLASYSARFDKSILPLCKDDRIPPEKKLEKLNEYIKDAETHEKTSKALVDKFNQFKSNFKGFVDTFSSWAKSKIDSEKARLATLEAELKVMQKTLDNWGKAMKISGSVAGAGLFTVILVGMLGPVGLLLIVVGFIGAIALAGGLLSALICWIGYRVQKGRVEKKEKEIEKLKKEIQELTDARLQLEKLGRDSLATVNGNIDVLSSIWQAASRDAGLIKAELEHGKFNPSQPDLLLANAGVVAGTYKSMADYLTQYADGIHTGSLPKGNPPEYKE